VLVLIRHGETVANAQRRLLGRLESPLTERGRLQAQAIADLLARRGAVIDRVVSSPLGRARETAAVLGPPVEIDERWVELDYGIHDGCELARVPAELWRAWRADPEFLPEGGESLAALGRRVRAACDELAADGLEQTVAVVSHVSPIKAAVAWALGADDGIAWRMHLDTGSVTTVAVGPVGPTLRTYNELAAG
jgi:broad specificity phosphatase PhoE